MQSVILRTTLTIEWPSDVSVVTVKTADTSLTFRQHRCCLSGCLTYRVISRGKNTFNMSSLGINSPLLIFVILSGINIPLLIFLIWFTFKNLLFVIRFLLLSEAFGGMSVEKILLCWRRMPLVFVFFCFFFLSTELKKKKTTHTIICCYSQMNSSGSDKCVQLKQQTIWTVLSRIRFSDNPFALGSVMKTALSFVCPPSTPTPNQIRLWRQTCTQQILSAGVRLPPTPQKIRFGFGDRLIYPTDSFCRREGGGGVKGRLSASKDLPDVIYINTVPS